MTIEEQIKADIEKLRAERYIGPPTEFRYYEKKLEFLRKWIEMYVYHLITQEYAKNHNFGIYQYHIGTRPFEEAWKIETGEITLWA